MKIKLYRQGDLAFEVTTKKKFEEETKEVEKSDGFVLLQGGSGGNPHTFTGGEFYPREQGEFTIGYFKASENCRVRHIEHGDKQEGSTRSGKLPKNFYKVIRQNEETIKGLKKVID